MSGGTRSQVQGAATMSTTSGGGGPGKDPNKPIDLPNIHKENWQWSELEKKTLITKDFLNHIYEALKYSSKMVPHDLKRMKEDTNLAPTYEVDWSKNVVEDDGKSMDVTKFSHYAPALIGQVSKSRVVNDGNTACNNCQKGNGKLGSCVQVQGKDELLFNGACCNCFMSTSSRSCSLASDYNAEPKFKKGAKAAANSPSKVTKTGKCIRIPVPTKSNLTTHQGLALVLGAIGKAQSELGDAAGKKKGKFELSNVYKLEKDDDEEEEEDDG